MASPSTSRGPSRPRSPRPAAAGYSPEQWVHKPQPSVSTPFRPAAAGYSPEQWVVVADGGQPGAERHQLEDDDDPGPPLQHMKTVSMAILPFSTGPAPVTALLVILPLSTAPATATSSGIERARASQSACGHCSGGLPRLGTRALAATREGETSTWPSS